MKKEAKHTSGPILNDGETPKGLMPLAGPKHYECAVMEIERLADDHAHICSKLAEQYKSDPVLFAALTDAAAIIRDLMRELRRETERRWDGNRRAAQEYVDDMRDVLKEAARVCKDLDDEALAKENRLACGAECAAAIEDLAARMNVHWEVSHE